MALNSLAALALPLFWSVMERSLVWRARSSTAIVSSCLSSRVVVYLSITNTHTIYFPECVYVWGKLNTISLEDMNK